jgi:NAD(P)-dependent dehydrogenase (short-subunit alcohol dehydrogenase family)
VIAVVTGGGSGIGKAVALALARDGWRVVVAGRREEALAGTASEVPGGAIVPVPADVRDPSSVAELFARTESAFGRLDLLFNNAGVNGPPVPLEEVPYQSWSAVLETNVTGTFLCTQQAVALMKRQEPRGGRIVNNGSLSAYVPRPGSAPYTAAKHAITGLTRSTALDGRPFDIACGQIDIGNAATEMAAGVAGTEPTIDVEAVARAVLYMASLPFDANVLFMTVMATKMPYVGRG